MTNEIKHSDLDLIGLKSEPVGGIDIRKIFKTGKGSDRLTIRVGTRMAEWMWNTGIILGAALADVPQKR